MPIICGHSALILEKCSFVTVFFHIFVQNWIVKNLNTKYTSAVEAIKTAILQGQYEAAKGVNRIQLAVYFGIGKYISLNTRKGVWGTGALKIISDRLQKELPGLRVFSENSLKNMRKFYEEWQMLDANLSVITDDLQKSNSTTTVAELQNTNSAIAIAEL